MNQLFYPSQLKMPNKSKTVQQIRLVEKTPIDAKVKVYYPDGTCAYGQVISKTKKKLILGSRPEYVDLNLKDFDKCLESRFCELLTKQQEREFGVIYHGRIL